MKPCISEPEAADGTDQRPFRIGWIGCGARGSGYPMYLRRLGFPFDLVAVADPVPEQIDLAVSHYGSPATRRHADAEEMLSAVGGDLDGVIVAGPNFCHADHAVAVLDRGIPLLLEKPVAIDTEQLARLWKSACRASMGCVIGFTMRYTPFYRKVRELVRQGVLGRILSIQAEELMSDRLTSLFSRCRWRPDPSLSGGLMIEKCCHDMDMLSWITGSRVENVQSFCRRTFLRPIPGAADTCDVCKLNGECRFSYEKILDSFRGNRSSDHFEKLASQTFDQRCVYRSGLDYPDHQTLNLSFENGVLAAFNVAMAQPKNERTISISGTDARLYGEFERSVITIVHRTGPNNEQREEIRIEHDESGHGGGDSHLVKDFVSLMQGEANSFRASLKDAIASCAVCLAADQSCAQQRMVPMREYWSAVFQE